MSNITPQVEDIMITDDQEGDNKNVEMANLHRHKRVNVIKDGRERKIKIELVVENFRLAFYITFIFMIALGAVLSTQLSEYDYKEPLRTIFGAVNVCVFIDYPPSTYVVPNLWVISLFFMEAYILVSVFRVWIAKEENKVLHVYSLAILFANIVDNDKIKGNSIHSRNY